MRNFCSAARRTSRENPPLPKVWRLVCWRVSNLGQAATARLGQRQNLSAKFGALGYHLQIIVANGPHKKVAQKTRSGIMKTCNRSIKSPAVPERRKATTGFTLDCCTPGRQGFLIGAAVRFKPGNLVGNKFGHITIIGGKRLFIRTYHWLGKCVCGKVKYFNQNRLLSGQVSCGCRNGRHRMSHTRIYKTWSLMKRRCLNINDRRYHDYGGRGIKVCQRWMKFENFFEDMGTPPAGKTLDRINNCGDYEPGNCRWATRSEQQNNRRNNHFLKCGKKVKTIAQWVKITGSKFSRIATRIHRGWSATDAVFLPSQKHNKSP